MNWAGYIVIISWMIFLIVWVVSSLHVKRNLKDNYTGWTVRLIIAVILIFILHLHIFSKQESTIHNLFLNIVGVLICICCIGFASWARRHLGRNWGMPMSIKAKPELVTSGPYHFVRHPIYTGVLTAMIGSMLVVGYYWIVPIIVFCIYFIYSAKQEEKLMKKEFPDTYEKYMKQSKMIIPFIL